MVLTVVDSLVTQNWTAVADLKLLLSAHLFGEVNEYEVN